jgi:HSP20 family molecular chaperone IbpA
MDRVIYDLIEDQLRSIYRAVTGCDAPVDEREPDAPAGPVSDEDLVRRFADVEATVRAVPAIAERIPPFAFTPHIDVFETGDALVIEAAVPGLEDEEVEVGLINGSLWLSGVRRGDALTDGRQYLHAEIPRGPFRRLVALPFPVAGEPEVTTHCGLVRIEMRRRAEDAATEGGDGEATGRTADAAAKRKPRPKQPAKRATKR